jgi:hypothetical protein
LPNAAYFLRPEGALGDSLLPLLRTPDFQGFREKRKLACALRKLRLQKVCRIRLLAGMYLRAAGTAVCGYLLNLGTCAEREVLKIAISIRPGSVIFSLIDFEGLELF